MDFVSAWLGVNCFSEGTTNGPHYILNTKQMFVVIIGMQRDHNI